MKGRFAPSPSGRMHAGNIYAALVAWLVAHAQGGTIVLRIEDLDQERSKAEYCEAILRDFAWLGLTWDEGPFYQHDRIGDYDEAFHWLSSHDMLYPCFCTRAEIAANAVRAPHFGEKRVYAGTCRKLSSEEVGRLMRLKKPSWRVKVPHEEISFIDGVYGRYTQNLALECGDFLVRRADGASAYQLAVVLDDADEGIDSIVRGVDLLPSTPQQLWLRRLVRPEVDDPQYAHVPLLVSSDGKRLAKRDHDASIDELKTRYKTAAGVIGHIAFAGGLIPNDEPIMPEELRSHFSLLSYSDSISGKIALPWAS